MPAWRRRGAPSTVRLDVHELLPAARPHSVVDLPAVVVANDASVEPDWLAVVASAAG